LPKPAEGVSHPAAGQSSDNLTMTTSLQHLLDNNRQWSARMVRDDPAFFSRLANQQNPKYLWIGCSDSRVPANQITGLDPGEVFVHRNVANVVVHSDLNALSVIQYAVDALKVEHIMVVGHYGCGGVLATLRGMRVGLADNWLRHVHDVKVRHRRRLDHLTVPEQEDALCEMNVIEQVGNVALTNVVQDAWSRGQKLSVHGWCYGLKDGLAKDLGVSMSGSHEVVDVFRSAFKRYPRGGL
jgi:carbonic anhydrase